LISVIVATRKEPKLTQEELANGAAKLLRINRDRHGLQSSRPATGGPMPVELIWIARPMKNGSRDATEASV
jgi:hypothetical protein